jgi:lipoprotein-releasing system ATP-binding protein
LTETPTKNASTGPVLVLDNVTKEFVDGDVVSKILHGISLTIGPSELVALIGPSGSGKSTLLNIIGLLDRPTTGTIHVGGVDATHLDDAGRTSLRNHALGFVFQFHHLIGALTAEENVRIPLALERGWMSDEHKPRARELLEAVGMGEKVDAPIRKLSGGQQQRVAIARALVNDPRLVLADEPTGNLDTKAADQVFELFRRVHQERNMAFLIVTHDPRLAARCDRILKIVDGKLVSDERVDPNRKAEVE